MFVFACTERAQKHPTPLFLTFFPFLFCVPRGEQMGHGQHFLLATPLPLLGLAWLGSSLLACLPAGTFSMRMFAIVQSQRANDSRPSKDTLSMLICLDTLPMPHYSIMLPYHAHSSCLLLWKCQLSLVFRWCIVVATSTADE